MYNCTCTSTRENTLLYCDLARFDYKYCNKNIYICLYKKPKPIWLNFVEPQTRAIANQIGN